MKLDTGQLQRRCLMNEASFSKEIGYNPKGKFWFKDNGGSVLAVAHLDTVITKTRFLKVVRLGKDVLVFSPQLDDRLGAYLILDYLPSLGLNYDILLTTDEERVKSTASEFEPPKEYNWAFSFDRAGTDVVLYQYEDAETKSKLQPYWKTSQGTYSDIAELNLGVKCFNIGAGYYEQHTTRCWADLGEVDIQMSRFLAFWAKHKDNPMLHTGDKEWRRSWVYTHHAGWVKVPDRDGWEADCAKCGVPHSMCDCYEGWTVCNWNGICHECGNTIGLNNYVYIDTDYFELCVSCAGLYGIDPPELKEEDDVGITSTYQSQGSD